MMIELAQSPTVRAFLQFIPGGIGSALDVFLTDGARMLQEERLRVFFDQLAAGEAKLTPELVKSHEFLHCFFSATRAATRTRREEKIRMFARALTNGIKGNGAASVDEFEEALSVVDELSFREWSALIIFQDMIDQVPADENQLKRVMEIWEPFKERVHKELCIPIDEVEHFIQRTSRTGLFSRLTGFWGDNGNTGMTTPMFIRIRRLVSNREGD